MAGNYKADLSEAKLLHNLSVLSKYYPTNAYYIQNAYFESHNLKQAQRMVEAVDMYMQQDPEYNKEVNEFVESSDAKQEKLKAKSRFSNG